MPTTRLTSPWSLAGVCAAAVPVSRDGDGAPVALQVVGQRGGENSALGVAALLEQLAGGAWPSSQHDWLAQRPQFVDCAADILRRGRHLGVSPARAIGAVRSPRLLRERQRPEALAQLVIRRPAEFPVRLFAAPASWSAASRSTQGGCSSSRWTPSARDATLRRRAEVSDLRGQRKEPLADLALAARLVPCGCCVEQRAIERRDAAQEPELPSSTAGRTALVAAAASAMMSRARRLMGTLATAAAASRCACAAASRRSCNALTAACMSSPRATSNRA